MKVLLAGDTGFTGKAFVRHLINEGCQWMETVKEPLINYGMSLRDLKRAATKRASQ